MGMYHIYIYRYVYVQIYIYIYTCIQRSGACNRYVCMYVCMYVCVTAQAVLVGLRFCWTSEFFASKRKCLPRIPNQGSRFGEKSAASFGTTVDTDVGMGIDTDRDIDRDGDP